jgi:hypothetical protein
MSEHTTSGIFNVGTDMRNISNSEVATWLACKRQYYYEFDLNLEPKSGSSALDNGTLLHEVLAFYYDGLKAGLSHAQAVEVARKHLMTFMATVGMYELDTIMKVDKLLQGYWDYYQGDPDWEILEVEKSYELPISPSFTFAMRLDLLVRVRSTGKVLLVDHKTAYNFWSQDDMELNPQFPKYIGALRANGIYVDGAILNQIRTRSIKNPTTDQLFKRAPYKPTPAKINEAMKEQVISSQEIAQWRELPLEVRKDRAVRVLQKAGVCKWCNVKSLCLSEYDGGDITTAIQNDYRQNTYGYNKPLITEEM